jgi:hypothetical protein
MTLTLTNTLSCRVHIAQLQLFFCCSSLSLYFTKERFTVHMTDPVHRHTLYHVPV